MMTFRRFCGGTFWNTTLTWDGDIPRFTECFQHTVLIWVPCAFLWLLTIPYSIHLAKVRGYPIRRNKFNLAKLLLSVILTLVALSTCIKAIVDYVAHDDDKMPPAYLVTPAILTLTLFLTVILNHVERKKGFITSGVLFIFWVLLSVAGIVPFYMKIVDTRDSGHVDDWFDFITFYFYYFFLIVQLILFCLADELPVDLQPQYGRVPSPEITASFLSRITFWWLNRLVYLGYKKNLEAKDLFELNPRDCTSTSEPVLQKAWRKEVKRVKRARQKEEKKKLKKVRKSASEKTPLLNGAPLQEPEVEGKKKKQKKPSFLWVLTKVYGTTLIRAHLCKVVCDLLTFTGPLIQQQLIGYTETAAVDNAYVQQWKGYLYAVLFLVTSIANSLFFHQLFHISMTLGMRIRAAIVAAVYKKALVMSNQARKTTTVGEIVNLMSVDAQRMQDVTGYLWMLWSAPLQIIIATALIWQQLGPSVLAGLAVMVLLIPLNGFMAQFQRKWQNQQMTQKDKRIKLMNEILSGMKVLKLYAWELSFKEKVEAIRNIELETLRKYAYLSAVGSFTWTCAPFLVLLTSLAAFVLSGNQLTATNAFVSLSLFNILRFPMNLLPMMVTYIVTASVSVRRLSNFLQNEDIDFNNVENNSRAEYPIQIENGEFAWGLDKDDSSVLKKINMKVEEGQLVAVVGQVGNGKSSLLSAILGEMEKIRGRVIVKGSIAYVAQQAWIQNCTLKDNVLFEHPLDDDRYQQCLEACALLPDLDILPAGDKTEIGEKGINLSGGQKQRISLARAVYSDRDIYLLDDPLSAVDSHVGKHIFHQVIGGNGLLCKKTRVLVTHGIQWLPMVDKIFVILNGEISEEGSYDELLSHDGPFAQFLKSFFKKEVESESEDEDVDPEVKAEKQRILQRLQSVVGEDDLSLSPKLSDKDSDKSSHKKRSRKGSERVTGSAHDSKHVLTKQKSKVETGDKGLTKAGTKLIEEEKQELGEVKASVYWSYIKSQGALPTLAWFSLFLVFQALSVYSSVWLSLWTEDKTIQEGPGPNNTDYDRLSNMYLGVYGGLGGAQALFVLLYALIMAVSMVRASKVLHECMLYNILRSPMVFFETTPLGRILNRFSRDIETIDNTLPGLIRSWIMTFFSVITTIIIISYSTPLFLSVIVPLFILYYFVQRFYIPTSRQLQRIQSTTRSPIYSHFSESITGASTIRAYKVQQRFIEINENKVDYNQVFYFAQIASNRWLGFRLEFLGALVVFAAAVFAVVSANNRSIAPSLVGLSISYALQVTGALNWMVRMTSDLETNVVSVERVKEYTETPTEGEWQVNYPTPPRDWPNVGHIAFEDYSTRYRPGLDLVLRRITTDINGGEKVGIVGRTGAGKSSLTLALFRLIEAAEGSIVIDGLNIGTLGLHQLRSKITILPQDPVLFSGTLRMNLDPFDTYTDEKIWTALEHAHLKTFVAGLPAKLLYECGEGGQNLSVGQRQLVCLARTLLRKTKILVLDEATAAVDLETDELIQKTINTAFADCTVITIAHRLNTVVDYNRILVLDSGQIAEFDDPQILLQNKGSKFYAMAKDAGLVS